MLDKLKEFYEKNTMYVNIALGAVIVYIGYKLLKKK
jgi:hypothetical protein